MGVLPQVLVLIPIVAALPVASVLRYLRAASLRRPTVPTVSLALWTAPVSSPPAAATRARRRTAIVPAASRSRLYPHPQACRLLRSIRHRPVAAAPDAAAHTDSDDDDDDFCGHHLQSIVSASLFFFSFLFFFFLC